ncbi:MAG: hypothetical protein ACMXYL_05820 [Candidatus Woesearchaeota archaeon]
MVNALNNASMEIGAASLYSFPNSINPRLKNQSEYNNISLGNVPFMKKSIFPAYNKNHAINHNIHPDTKALWEEMSSEFSFGIEKTPDYLRWRYFDNPHNHQTYIPISIEDATCMTKKYDDGSTIRGHIVDIISARPQATKELLSQAESYYAHVGAEEISIFMFPGTHHHKTLLDMGYVDIPWDTQIAYTGFSSENHKVNPYIMMGDSDTF